LRERREREGREERKRKRKKQNKTILAMIGLWVTFWVRIECPEPG
jgi:hypothetical protein